jgi:DNA processing protein
MVQASPYAIALSHFAPFGSRTYLKLFEHFQDYVNIWQATPSELSQLNLHPEKLSAFVHWRDRTNPQALADQVSKLGITTVDRHSPNFPEALKTIHDPPIILYIKGTLPNTNTMVGIVGAREATDYGQRITQGFARDLAQAGLVIVSGLARGIDTCAHTAAMSVGGQTIAVVAQGLEKLESNKQKLAEQIIDCGGAIISEQPPYQTAAKFHFPIRNRIIAGLSQAVLVVEAKLPSGSITTAKSALENARDVFAVPGNIDSPASQGTNTLIQDGAQVALSANNILLSLGIAKPAPTQPVTKLPVLDTATFTTDELHVLSHLTAIPQHVDDIARYLKLPTASLLATLTMLEIHGRVRHLGNMHYSL